MSAVTSVADARNLLTRLNPAYPFDFNYNNYPTRYIIEYMQTLLNQGYTHNSTYNGSNTFDERLVARKGVVNLTFDNYKISIALVDTADFHYGVLCTLLRSKPVNPLPPTVDGRLAAIEKKWPGLIDKLAS